MEERGSCERAREAMGALALRALRSNGAVCCTRVQMHRAAVGKPARALRRSTRERTLAAAAAAEEEAAAAVAALSCNDMVARRMQG